MLLGIRDTLSSSSPSLSLSFYKYKYKNNNYTLNKYIKNNGFFILHT